MSLLAKSLGVKKLPEDILRIDKKNCRIYGPCGVGERALYLNGKYIERRYYVIWSEVSRLYKRVAMSRGGFTGKGVFASVPFLVADLKDGSSREFAFKNEADVDNLLNDVKTNHPGIPTLSESAEQKLAASESAERERYLKELSRDASDAVCKLEEDREYLEQNTRLSEALTSAAKQKRIADKLPLSFKLIGFAQLAVGIAAVLYGLFCLVMNKAYAVYFILGGGAALFIALSTGAFPGKRYSKTKAQEDWDAALDAMREYLKDKPDFFLPAQYAHPVVIERIIRIIREGCTADADEAFHIMKNELKALDNTVMVSQKEYDEVVKIKPLFLVCDYRDE